MLSAARRHEFHTVQVSHFLYWLHDSSDFGKQNRREESGRKVLEGKQSGGREGIRTPGLLVANEETNLIRLGAATT